jgi:TusA-related sulfurtransferase
MKMVHEIMCMGEICPLPLLKAKKKYEEMKEGEILKVVVDHRCTLDNLETYFSKLNCSMEVKEVLKGVWEVYIKK